MTGFVSLPPLTDQDPPQARPPELIANDGFWPDIDLVQLRDAVRLDTTIPTERLADAVRNAMIDLARQLQDWRDTVAIGFAALDAVPPRRSVGDVSDYVLLYTRALYSLVGADLGERLLSQSTTAAGDDRRDSLASEISQHRRNARWAVSDFTGRRRVVCELL
ncbi:head completion/stabilization protein [Brevundimonas nasdae]|uniref:head completion/stabilization protein n=1 Tax=Brevundimonas nasdae TaxID=172043 RepID=UPI003F693CC4